MLRNRFLLVFLIWTAGWGGGVVAEDGTREEKIDELLKLVQEPEPFQPIDASRVERSKQRLLNALAELERQLGRLGDQQEKQWKTYLKWDELEQELAAEQPSRSLLLDIARKYRMNHAGLEMQVFMEVRGAIEDYANTSFFGSEAIAKRVYDSRLRLIESSLSKLKEGHDDRSIGLLGEAIADLENSGNCPRLVAAIRAAFDKPNFHFELSEALAKSVVENRETFDVRPLCEVILGVTQRGTAQTTARFDVDFVPCQRSGRFKVRINGTSLTDQVGTKELGLLGNVYICSEGTTCLVGEAVIEFDGRQLSYSDLAAGARTSSQVKGIDTPLLLRGATWKQIEKKKSEGEAEAAAKARAKFARQVRDQLNEAIGKANQKLKGEVRSTVKRLDFEPKRLEVTTSDEHFRILAIIGNEQHLTSLEGPSANVEGDVIAQLHESTINNGLQHLLGGRRIEMEEMRRMIESFGIELPPPPADEKPLAITFPRVRPIQIAFDGQVITTRISASEIQTGQTVVKDDLVITIKYSIDSTPNSVTVARTEDVRIDFEGDYTNAKSVVESNIKPRLEELLTKEPREYRIAEIKLPEQFAKVRLPEINRLEVDGGWLVAELKMSGRRAARAVPIRKLSGRDSGRPNGSLIPVRASSHRETSTAAFISDGSRRIEDRR